VLTKINTILLYSLYLKPVFELYLKTMKSNFFYNPSLFAICTKYNKQMGGNRNTRGGRELSSAHPYGGGARPGMVTGISYK
jgi:hypothetical protein